MRERLSTCDFTTAPLNVITPVGFSALMRAIGDGVQHLIANRHFSLSLEVISQYCHNLKSLEAIKVNSGRLQRCVIDGNVIFGRVFENCPKLQKCHLFGYRSHFGECFSSIPAGLVDLKFKCGSLDDNSLLILAERCPSLESFWLDGVHINQPIAAVRNFLANCASLKHFSYDGDDDHVGDFAKLFPSVSAGHQPLQLQSFRFSTNSRLNSLNGRFLQAIANYCSPHLKSLHVRASGAFRAIAITSEGVRKLAALKSLTHLHINLHADDISTLNALLEVADKLPLESLDIFGFGGVTFEEYSDVISRFLQEKITLKRLSFGKAEPTMSFEEKTTCYASLIEKSFQSRLKANLEWNCQAPLIVAINADVRHFVEWKSPKVVEILEKLNSIGASPSALEKF